MTRLAWGRMDVRGVASGKDFKLYPGGGREWDWRETGTAHSPGIQPADVEELLEHGVDVVVLSRGMLRRLKVCPETLLLLEERGVRVHVDETRKAVERYNELASSGNAVGGLFHSTC
ncbi:MAG TPA: Mth938-like domain-containing protein [Vicinamibacteria bacterium]|nr:Mth938-like domain-containing protein [Vicinamibacteria bacterium]